MNTYIIMNSIWALLSATTIAIYCSGGGRVEVEASSNIIKGKFRTEERIPIPYLS